ncbi:MAG: glycosyltransferase family 2 protein [Thermoleophilaceae bacterium]|nr:glycosyltransferase family 2 protein [Thermoleophilaceae bacterium]
MLSTAAASRRPPPRSRISVVIPTKDEASNVAWVLERVPSYVDEVILVDGQSTDGTVEVARAVCPELTLVVEPRPGKGAALRAGFAAATGDIVVMLDADGSMDPGDIDRYVNRLEDGCDLVKGSRFRQGGGSSDISMLRKLGNLGLLRLFNLLYRSQFTELCYGFMGFRREKLAGLRLRADGFEIETEIVARAVRSGLVVGEIPSFEDERRHGESKLSPGRDGSRVLATLLRERFAERAYLPLAARRNGSHP